MAIENAEIIKEEAIKIAQDVIEGHLQVAQILHKTEERREAQEETEIERRTEEQEEGHIQAAAEAVLLVKKDKERKKETLVQRRLKRKGLKSSKKIFY